MRKNPLGEVISTSPVIEDSAQDTSLAAHQSNLLWPGGMVLYTLLFVGCSLLTINPLVRSPHHDLMPLLPLASFLGIAGNWLPLTLGTLSRSLSASLEFFFCVTLTFLCYGLVIWLVSRLPAEKHVFLLRCCIWFGTILAGGIFLTVPALLSHDVWVYAGYGRLLAAYHANPYFVTLSAFPHDPLVRVDDWANTNALYGPVWLLVCGLFGRLLGPDPLSYVIVYRIFALATHLLNIWLVGQILRTLNRSPRTVTLGMLFYAWNPLVLLESSLNGHNDVFMITFVLLAFLLGARAEKNAFLLRTRGYLLPIVMLTLAMLVKFTALPILAVYLLFLICRALRSEDAQSRDIRRVLSRWRDAVRLCFWSGLVALLTTSLFYGLFWFGHNLHDILDSFRNNGTSQWAVFSFMRSFISWGDAHPAQKKNLLLLVFTDRQVWNVLDMLAVALGVILGLPRLWRKPAMSTFIPLALAAMGLLLLFAPRFYPWYATWLVGLAAICVSWREDRFTRGLLAAALIASLSALSIYIPGLLGSRQYLGSLIDALPPVCAFLLFWGIGLWQRKESRDLRA